MPGWPFNTGSGPGPTPLHPPLLGLVQWTKSDVGLTVSPATRAAAWADQSGHGQDWQQNGNNPGNAPYVLGDDIDGIPLITFGAGVDANKSFNTPGTFKDRFGVDMDGAHARTVAVVTKPIFSGAYNRMGGPAWEANSWDSYFFFDPTGIVGPVDGAYAWIDNVGDFAHANNFTPQNGSGGGPYDGVPRLVVWSSTGRPQLTFSIDGVDVPLTPTTMHGAAGPASQAEFGDGLPCYLGGITEILVWDRALGPADLAALNAYIGSRYPSITLP